MRHSELDGEIRKASKCERGLLSGFVTPAMSVIFDQAVV